MLKMKPETAFLVIAIFFGILMTFITPPFQVPDEIVHFYRAYAISDGNIIMDKRESIVGAELPKSLTKLVEISSGIAFYPEVKQDLDELKTAFAFPLHKKDTEFVHVAGAANYAPIPYLAHIAALLIGQLLNIPILFLFYLTRLFGLAAWIALTWLAIKTIPYGKWFLFVMALLPMTLFEAIGVSADSMTNGLSFLFTAFIFKVVHEAHDQLERSHSSSPVQAFQFDKKTWALLIAISAVLPLCKNLYILLLGMLLLIPLRFWLNRPAHEKLFMNHKSHMNKRPVSTQKVKSNYNDKVQNRMMIVSFLGVLLCWGVALAIYFTWTALTAHLVENSIIEGVDPTLQLMNVFLHPRSRLLVIFRSMKSQFILHTQELIGVLGWLDTYLPRWLYILLSATIAGTVVLEGPVYRWQGRAWLAILFFGSSVLVFVSLYAFWTPVGHPLVQGVQGRYFIPFMPMLIGVLGLNSTLHLKSQGKTIVLSKYLLPWTIPIMTTGLLAGVVSLVLRYYIE